MGGSAAARSRAIRSGVNFARARAIADAVLWGAMRWPLGVLAPPFWAEASGEPTWQETDCLAVFDAAAELHVRVRFLRVTAQHVEELSGRHDVRRVVTLDLGERLLTSWDEAHPEELDLVLAASPQERSWRFVLPAHREIERVVQDGVTRARIVRERLRMEVRVRIRIESMSSSSRLHRIRLLIENGTLEGTSAQRHEAARAALSGTHALLALSSGEFVSLTDPPDPARSAAAGCTNVRTWPVLVGADEGRDVLLSSPIVLADHPEIALERARDSVDSSEADELLLLRALTLTDEEKREARANDPRAARILDHIEPFSRELLEHLHGAVRSFCPGARSERDACGIAIDGVPIARGSRVVLRPCARRADARERFLAGRTARVEAVRRDREGETHLAVSLDGDPSFLYFRLDEVSPAEPL